MIRAPAAFLLAVFASAAQLQGIGFGKVDIQTPRHMNSPCMLTGAGGNIVLLLGEDAVHH